MEQAIPSSPVEKIMVDKKTESELVEYAGGWMTERKGTDAPKFLKFATPIIALFGIVYVIMFMNGEVGHSTRGRLVQQFDAVTGFSSGFMYFVAALIAIYLIIVTWFAWGKADHD